MLTCYPLFFLAYMDLNKFIENQLRSARRDFEVQFDPNKYSHATDSVATQNSKNDLQRIADRITKRIIRSLPAADWGEADSVTALCSALDEEMTKNEARFKGAFYRLRHKQSTTMVWNDFTAWMTAKRQEIRENILGQIHAVKASQPPQNSQNTELSNQREGDKDLQTDSCERNLIDELFEEGSTLSAEIKHVLEEKNLPPAIKDHLAELILALHAGEAKDVIKAFESMLVVPPQPVRDNNSRPEEEMLKKQIEQLTLMHSNALAAKVRLEDELRMSARLPSILREANHRVSVQLNDALDDIQRLTAEIYAARERIEIHLDTINQLRRDLQEANSRILELLEYVAKLSSGVKKYNLSDKR